MKTMRYSLKVETNFGFSMNLFIVLGFIFTFISFLVAALGFDKSIYMVGFMVGFYSVTAGIVLKTIRIDSKEIFGMKIVAIGFFINSLNFLVEYIGLISWVGVILTWVGWVFMISGFVFFVKENKSRF